MMAEFLDWEIFRWWTFSIAHACQGILIGREISTDPQKRVWATDLHVDKNLSFDFDGFSLARSLDTSTDAFPTGDLLFTLHTSPGTCDTTPGRALRCSD